MKQLKDFREEIHKCSKCGLCQGVCPVYQVTGNDCTVSRGQFIMLRGVIDGDLQMSKKLNSYLDLCLKCGKCSEFCPSGIDVVDIIFTAKHEFFEKHISERFISAIQKHLVFGFLMNLKKLFSHKQKSKKFDKKVVYFGGCSAKFSGNRNVVKIMNNIGVEVITPDFSCCGIPFFARGDSKTFYYYMNKYIKTMKRYRVNEVITTCASCEKTIKDYAKWCDNEDDKAFLAGIQVKNIYEYLKENKTKLRLKKPVKVTYHKPCNLENYEDVKRFLNSIENLEYIEAENYDKCCGLNGIFKPKVYGIISKIIEQKKSSIISSGAEYVLTSCFGCQTALKTYLPRKYKVHELTKFISDHA